MKNRRFVYQPALLIRAQERAANFHRRRSIKFRPCTATRSAINALIGITNFD
jgi:hypothetical protein